MRLCTRVASLCAAAFLAVVLLPAAALAQDPVLTVDATTANVFDSDGDGVSDPVDNCVNAANPSQSNIDADGLGDACDPDDDGDGWLDARDNCPQVANPHQNDVDQDGIGDRCDVLETNDGFAGGGGRTGIGSTAVVSFAMHSHDGQLSGAGRVVDGTTTVQILDLTAMHSNGAWAVGVGTASVNGGAPVEYTLELIDDNNWVTFEVGGRTWFGPLGFGNIIVR